MKTIIYAVFATLCIHSVCCQKPTNTPDTKSFRIIGAKEKLVCVVSSTIDRNISWVKDNKEDVYNPIVLTYGNEVVIDDSRLSIEKESDTKLVETSRHTLTISNLMESDTGTYRCQAMLQWNNVIFTKVELEVHEPIPATIFNNVTSFVIVMEGRPLKLECYGTGYPVPSIYWTREDWDVMFTGYVAYKGNILETPAVKKEDRGNYYCTAENGITPVPKRKIGVIVEFPPTISTSLKRHRQALNYHVNLDCRIEASPTSTIIWMHNGMQLSNNQYYTITNKTSSSKVIVDSNLRINITEKHLYGDYICKTSNMFGDAEITIPVYESTYKVCPPVCD